MLLTPLALALVALTDPAPAHGYDPSTVSSEALWVIHFDFQQLVGSQLFGAIGANVGTDWSGESLKNWIQVQGDGLDQDGLSLIAKYGFNPLADLLDVTIYGTTEDEDTAVLLIQTTDRIDATLDKLHADFEQFDFLESNGRSFHALSDGGDKVLMHVHQGTPVSGSASGSGSRGSRSVVQPGQRTLVIGSNITRMLDAIAVLEGNVSGLQSSAHSIMQQEPNQNAILWIAAAQDQNQWRWDLDSAVAAKADNALFELGERNGEVYFDLAVGTRTSEDASDIVSTLQGLQAMARLMGPKGSEGEMLREVLGKLHLGQNGSRVDLQFAMPVNRILEIVGQISHEQELEVESGTKQVNQRDLSEAR